MWLKLVGLLAMPVTLYLAVLCYFFFAQSGMLFPVKDVPAAPAMPAASERLEITARDGVTLIGTYLPPREFTATRRVILGFGGNGWNADAAALKLSDLYPAADIVTFHYRGYPPSDGVPGTDAFVADARTIHDHLRKRFVQMPITAIGFSIGSGVAVSLAASRPMDGLILVTPFDSLTNVAAGHFPWLPVKLLLRQRSDPADDILRVRSPVAIIIAGNDMLIPPRHARALERVVPNLVMTETLVGTGHNTIYDDLRFRRTMRDALGRVSER